MQLKNDESRYGAVAQFFHWTIVILIIVQYTLANQADNLPLGSAKIAVLARHKSFGITILALVLLRLVWRWMGRTPADPPGTPQWQRLGARVSHFALYALLVVQPLSGWLMSSARNFPGPASCRSTGIRWLPAISTPPSRWDRIPSMRG